MNHSHRQRPLHALGPKLIVAAVILALTVSFTAIALASGSHTVTSASNSTIGEQIVVDAQGHTLYTLSPETTHHLLCKSNQCLKFWPPLTVHSSKTKLKAGPGVHGHLAILRRSSGKFQVTLAGRPLYRYSGDTAKGDANGQGLESFGGTWHVISASASGSTAPSTPTTPAPAPSTPEPHYGY
ncbi:MAG: COG4315 family predicted lipoprotein [Solirubrobacteraceae bacterium]